MNSVTFNEQSIQPSKIICIGRNYVEHIQELGNETPDDMVVFLKPNSAISADLHSEGDQVHYETELCFLIENNQLIGVGIGFDLTKRELQSKLKSKGLPWERAKAFDRSVVFSQFVELPNGVESMSFHLKINDQIIQVGDVDLMMYKPSQILSEVSQFMSLSDGDIIMTGTPKGVGLLKQGDHFSADLLHHGQKLLSQAWLVK